MHALVNSSEPTHVHGDTVTLACVNKLVCDQLMDDKRRDLVDQVSLGSLGDALSYPVRGGRADTATTVQTSPEEGPLDMFDNMLPPRDPRETRETRNAYSVRETSSTREEAPRKRVDADLRNHPPCKRRKAGGQNS